MSVQRPHATGCTCFGCKVSGLAFGALRSTQGPDPVQHIPLIAQRGPHRGKSVGENIVHWDGRMDATIRPETVRVSTKAS